MWLKEGDGGYKWLKLVFLEPLLLHIESSELRWFGHLIRMPLGRHPLETRPLGRKHRGSPRIRWSYYTFPLARERLWISKEKLHSEERRGIIEFPSCTCYLHNSTSDKWLDGWIDGSDTFFQRDNMQQPQWQLVTNKSNHQHNTARQNFSPDLACLHKSFSKEWLWDEKTDCWINDCAILFKIWTTRVWQ